MVHGHHIIYISVVVSNRRATLPGEPSNPHDNITMVIIKDYQIMDYIATNHDCSRVYYNLIIPPLITTTQLL